MCPPVSQPTLGEWVLGTLAACLSRLMASVMLWVSTSSRAQQRFFRVWTTRSTVLYWEFWTHGLTEA